MKRPTRVTLGSPFWLNTAPVFASASGDLSSSADGGRSRSPQPEYPEARGRAASAPAAPAEISAPAAPAPLSSTRRLLTFA